MKQFSFHPDLPGVEVDFYRLSACGDHTLDQRLGGIFVAGRLHDHDITVFGGIKEVGNNQVFTVFQDQTERFLTRQTAQIGVPVQLSQESANLSAAFGAIGGGVQAAGKAAGGDYAGAVMAGLSAVGSAADLAQSAPSSIGANGARAGLSGLIRLHSTFYTIAAGDDANQGRPLLEVVTPSTLGGYMQMFNGTVPMASGMTAQERDEINSYMESGFYYE